MSAPHKPWESVRDRAYQNTNLGVGPGRNVLHSHAPQPSGHAPTTLPVTSQPVTTLPPLPQRPQQLFNRPAFGMPATALGGYSGYSSGYGTYGGYGASSYGGYGGMYGMGGYGYGSFPVGGGFENRFLQVAEESSRDAFQSIESIVRAFTSVSMMLESTYYAMYSSFRAVLGVVDNFSRLRQIFVQFLSTITILKMVRNFYRRLLYWLGVMDHSPEADRVWQSVNAGEERLQQAVSPKWPLLTFLAFLFGGPYLISKFFSGGNPDSGGREWDTTKGRYIRAAYPHRAGTQAELGFEANELLNLAPQELQTCDNSGWLLASNQQGRVGFVPVTRLSAKVVKPSHDTPPPATPTTVNLTPQCSDSQTTETPSTESQ